MKCRACLRLYVVQSNIGSILPAQILSLNFTRFTYFSPPKTEVIRYIYIICHISVPPGAGGGGDSHMKVAVMLVVSLRGVNFEFWSHLGCSRQNAIIFNLAVKVSFRVAREEI